MARNHADYARAIENAQDVFMRKGFEAATIDDLVAATGLNRYALYTAFGGKTEIFEACVKSYCETALESLRSLAVTEAIPPQAAALANLDAAAKQMCELKAGCLVCENISCVSGAAPRLAKYCAEYFERKWSLAAVLFKRAQSQGKLAPSLTPESAASVFMIFKWGLSNEVKLNPDLDMIRPKLQSFVSSLVPAA